jgi:hypothetical protein
MSSTKLTAPSRNVRPVVALPKYASCSSSTRAPAAPGFSPRASISWREIVVASAWAAASDTPGFRRPTASIHRASGILRRSLAAQNAMLSSHGTSANPRGITPMIVRGSPSTLIDIPITSLAPPAAAARCRG